MEKIDWSYYGVLNAMHCGMITSILYMLPLRKRSRFPARLCISILCCLLLTPIFEVTYRNVAGIFLANTVPDTWLRLELAVIPGALVLLFHLSFFTAVFRFCCDLPPGKALYGCLCAYVAQDLVYVLFVIFFPASAHRSTIPLNGRTLWLELLFMLVFYPAIYLLSAKKLPYMGDYLDSCRKLIPHILAPYIIRKITGVYVNISTTDSMMYRIAATYVCLFLSETLYVQTLVRQREEMAAESAAHERMRREYENQYNHISASSEYINQVFHDLKHLQRSLNGENASDSGLHLARELEKAIQTYDSRVHTGYQPLDLYLTSIAMKCSQNHIAWTCLADGALLSFMKPVDLIVMLGNAMDNALEGALQVEDPDRRFLSLTISRKQHMALITVKNACREESLTWKGDIPLSSKPGAGHGYGVKSILNVCEAYGGSCTMRAENQTFILNILLPLPKETG